MIAKGQIWESKHKADNGRRVVVELVTGLDSEGGSVYIRTLPNGRRSETRKSVFMRGYRLIEEPAE